jgi:sulfur carrier protein
VPDDFISSGGLRLPNSKEMKISLNGETVDTCEAKTIAELMGRYQFPPQSILVEHNGLAVHRHEWPERAISEGDRIELIRVVAGG